MTGRVGRQDVNPGRQAIHHGPRRRFKRRDFAAVDRHQSPGSGTDVWIRRNYRRLVGTVLTLAEADCTFAP